MDEVIAELTGGFVMADLGAPVNPAPEQAAYIGSRLKVVMKNDPRAIFTAASKE